MLASMDEDGFAPFSSIENLSRRANVALEETKKAVEVLEAPDKYNQNDEFEGRRIERAANGWVVLKGPYYGKIFSREVQREQTRIRVAEWRAKRKGDVTYEKLPSVTNVTDVTVTPHIISDHSTSDQSTPLTPLKGGSAHKAHPTSCEAVVEFCKSVGLPATDGEAMWNKWQARGYGKMKDWRATIRQWKSFGYLPSQRQSKDNRLTPLAREKETRREREMREAQERYDKTRES